MILWELRADCNYSKYFNYYERVLPESYSFFQAISIRISNIYRTINSYPLISNLSTRKNDLFVVFMTNICQVFIALYVFRLKSISFKDLNICVALKCIR